MSAGLIIAIVLGYFAVLITISLLTSRGATNASFFVGNRKSPWYVVAFGMIGASLSGVTFISVPGGVASGQMGYMQVVFGYLIGYFIIAFVLMPIYYKMNLTSIYTYLGTRFGKMSHKTGAAFFLLSRIIGASIRLLLVAVVLQEILLDDWDVPFVVTVIISVALIWLYTMRGGIKTIIWTDTLQTAFMLIAVGLAIYVLKDAIPAVSEKGIITGIADSGYSKIFDFSDMNAGGFFWKSFIGGIFIAIGMTGLDQDMMQKNLSCKNLKQGQTNMISFAIVLVFVNLIFLGLGAMLYMYNAETGIADAVIANGDKDLLFSTIALDDGTGLAIGILFLLGLIAAAYSSADSALTSLTTSFSIDFLNIEKKKEKQQVKTRRIVHAVMSGVLVIVVLFLHEAMDESAIWTLIKLAGFTYGPLIALFFFGILTKLDLRNQLVLPACVVSSAIMAILWCFSTGGPLSGEELGIFGEYKFGAELIVYNSILSFLFLLIISKKKTGYIKPSVEGVID
jgi:Na+/proline symporter